MRRAASTSAALALLAALTLALTGCTTMPVTGLAAQAATRPVPSTPHSAPPTSSAPCNTELCQQVAAGNAPKSSDSGSLSNTGGPPPADVTLTVHVLDQACYPDTGCTVDYEINPSYDGPPVAPGNWLITFEVDGATDGPQENELHVSSSGTATLDSDFSAHTAAPGVKLTAHVERVQPDQSVPPGGS
jgi:hypothetical protein